MSISKQAIRQRIAKRVAQEFNDGDVVNLGIGLPTLVANEISPEIEILFQAENGLLGIGEMADETNKDWDLVNAGAQYVTAVEGAGYFNSADSFAIIRGGHVDATVLGALEVDEQGNLANWIVPGKMVPGMGGAMDLVVGAKKVIIAMEHTAKGNPKLLKQCTLPLTATGQVDMVVTELGVFEITSQGMVMTEIAEGVRFDEVQSQTEAPLIPSPSMKIMNG
ncbi:Butyrate--acetoacetate CoA-transferase subunit B [Vibrio nigripulchritudo SFn27]|uniref:Butyrate--acetoacetate CoA-transferase subunit B n=1 Tax=Vibrio nigripulchritudo TaxID=28173 RepID=U4KI92_9VIBR|nr:3-oxoacid CoA-transferase subunit B [Vibrio nigripulchritudo]CCN82421.1 Butyrate--acetoacetate CoA-transferase subunit B [Vibrio nigripulchritudo BLFn1]CCN91407.1 Butyrate--acetoacetate CoA-transferase subunit B [Vibrio nigripulchritudo SFn27]CCN97572.1 Butyrate--acetoacetate CoA-transferase subunit B [Vibrio nigripulchritudo ENn2]CCO38714.1 Butyrate--acetoacetate CoA-transferase subunit B [Vibrio nigripulchritudo SFn135]CCO55119.1 Butyrate--acetoacetate CoA-transferase subunit B [Vibrio ni